MNDRAVSLVPRDGRLRAAAAEVHIWKARLTQPAHDVAWHQAVLSPDELARAERFHFPNDRRHFILAHGILRALLGRYLDAEPQALRFAYGQHGKPALVTRPGWPDLRFNLSHAGDLVVYAVGCGRDVGIDIERHNPAVDHMAVAESCFTPNEIRTMADAPPEARQALFFTYWSRKEALIKAHGGGVNLDLRQIDVSSSRPLQAPGPQFTLLLALPDTHEWYTVLDLALEPNYAASCAVDGSCPPPCFRVGKILVSEHAGQLHTVL